MSGCEDACVLCVQSSDSENNFLQCNGDVDLGRELSLLHSILLDLITRAPEVFSIHLLCT